MKKITVELEQRDYNQLIRNTRKSGIEVESVVTRLIRQYNKRMETNNSYSEISNSLREGFFNNR